MAHSVHARVTAAERRLAALVETLNGVADDLDAFALGNGHVEGDLIDVDVIAHEAAESDSVELYRVEGRRRSDGDPVVIRSAISHAVLAASWQQTGAVLDR